jgi:arylamine N-acetyltransferase
LKLLKIDAGDPTFKLLQHIVRAHLNRVPFENISKLLYKKQGMSYIPDLSIFLCGIENNNFGGTCYANNYYLYLLLKRLGYDIKLCGADMRNPDVHLISIITINEREYIVDCGYAAPFFNPLPRDLKENYIINLGSEQYLIKPKDKDGNTGIEQYLDAKLQHWYTAKPYPRIIEEFRKVIKDSYADDAVFMNAIRITKFSEKGSLVLKNLYLTETVDNKSSTRKINRDIVPKVVHEKFGMPSRIVEEAICNLGELKDVYNS